MKPSTRAVPAATATDVGGEVADGAAVGVAGEAGEADPPPPGWRHCLDGGYVRLPGVEAEAAAEAAAVRRLAVPLALLSSSESNGRADTPHEVAETLFALKADVDVRSNPCLLSTRV